MKIVWGNKQTRVDIEYEYESIKKVTLWWVRFSDATDAQIKHQTGIWSERISGDSAFVSGSGSSIRVSLWCR